MLYIQAKDLLSIINNSAPDHINHPERLDIVIEEKHISDTHCLPLALLKLKAVEILDMLEYVAPDREKDLEQLDSDISIFHKEEPFCNDRGEEMAAGTYMFLTDYPEEGMYGPYGSEEAIQEIKSLRKLGPTIVGIIKNSIDIHKSN